MTILGQFGEPRSTPTYGGTAGPAAQPDPAARPEDRQHDDLGAGLQRSYYDDLLFSETPGDSSMRNYYIENRRAGTRSTATSPTGWRCPFNEAELRRELLRRHRLRRARGCSFEDAANAWYNAQIAAGKTPAQINAYLAQFDSWDRYDYDGDGNFNEPDGYIDHFQAVHAGVGEETGGGAQGTDAIWSHRWYAVLRQHRPRRPARDKSAASGSANRNYWIGDYTIEPENGGVGVFAHEFGHDLGLPDEYDTRGNTGGAENSTGFWTHMVERLLRQRRRPRGHRQPAGPDDRLGQVPARVAQLRASFAGRARRRRSSSGRPRRTRSRRRRCSSSCPTSRSTRTSGRRSRARSSTTRAPATTSTTTMTRSVTLPGRRVSLTAKVGTTSRSDWDYAYLDGQRHAGSTNLSELEPERAELPRASRHLEPAGST